jgi:transposase
MSTSNTGKRSHPSQRRYPPEIRERAVRMVREALKESDRSHGLATRVAGQLGLGSERSRPRAGVKPGSQLPEATIIEAARAMTRRINRLEGMSAVGRAG